MEVKYNGLTVERPSYSQVNNHMKQMWLLNLVLEGSRTCDETSAELHHNILRPRQTGKLPHRHMAANTLKDHTRIKITEVAEYRVEMKPVIRLPLRSAAVQYSAWWTLPCSETKRRQKNSVTRKWSERSRRQEGKLAKFWLTQVVSFRFSIFCDNKKKKNTTSL